MKLDQIFLKIVKLKKHCFRGDFDSETYNSVRYHSFCFKCVMQAEISAFFS